LTHWCWLQALLSGHSESLSHSPILTAQKNEIYFWLYTYTMMN
jgi:hypothetical protein